MKRRELLAGASAAGLAVAAPAAHAQAYPAKPITVVVPFAAGGPTDALARVLCQKMSEVLAQQLIVENIGGAGGTIGVNKVAKANNDGYTLLFTHMGTLAVNIALYKSLPYDSQKDLEPIGLGGTNPMVLVTKKALPATNFAEFQKYVTENQKKVQYGMAGIGSASHLGGLMLNSMMKVDVLEIPYKGTGPALNDLSAGVVDAYFGDPATLGIIKAGKARAMAVSSPERWPLLPDAASLSEAVKGYEAWNWYGLDAPPGTPDAIADLLSAAVRKVMAEPEVKKKYDENGLHPATMTRADYAEFIKRDSEVWGKVIRTGNIKPDE